VSPFRVLVAAVVWAGAVAAVVGLTQAADDYARGGTKSRAATTTTTQPPRHEPRDISRDLPPRPGGTIPATSPDSLFRRANLVRVIDTMTHEFGGGEDLIAFALYPGEADFVVAEQGDVQVVRVPVDGKLDLGGWTSFSGTRTAITLQQIVPGSLARTLDVVVRRGHVQLADIDRVVLDLTSFGDLAGYRIEPREGLTTYKALLTGGRVDAVGPGGTTQLR
jgi:hypothetical protein